MLIAKSSVMPEQQDIVLPPEFSGEAQLILYTRYGDPRDAGWEQKWLTSWNIKERFPWFPADHISVHKHFKPLLEAAFTELETAGPYEEIITFDNGYELRPIKGSTVLSVHCWGAGIDMNAVDNPSGSKGKWSDEFIKIMERNNIFCGQSWTGRKDPMHFSMVNG